MPAVLNREVLRRGRDGRRRRGARRGAGPRGEGRHLLRHLLGRNVRRARRRSPRRRAKGAVVLAMLPDTGERYLSTILFEGVNEGSDEEAGAGLALAARIPGGTGRPVVPGFSAGPSCLPVFQDCGGPPEGVNRSRAAGRDGHPSVSGGPPDRETPTRTPRRGCSTARRGDRHSSAGEQSRFRADTRPVRTPGGPGGLPGRLTCGPEPLRAGRRPAGPSRRRTGSCREPSYRPDRSKGRPDR